MSELNDKLARILTEAVATGGVIHANSTLVDQIKKAFSEEYDTGISLEDPFIANWLESNGWRRIEAEYETED
jgi:hypothetical protein